MCRSLILEVSASRRRRCLNLGATPPTPEPRSKSMSTREVPSKSIRTHRGNKGPFGMGRSSRSKAIFAAAWKPCIRMISYQSVIQSIHIFRPSPHSGVTHLDPIHDAGDIAGLQQKLLPLHANADHIPPLHVVAPQPAFRVAQGVRVQQVLLLRLRDGGVIDPEGSPLHARRAGCAW